MQYYKSHMDYRHTAMRNSGGIAVSLNQAAESCIDEAKSLYACKISFANSPEILYGAESFEEIARRLADMLDQLCREYNKLEAVLERTEALQARLVFKDEYRAVVGECRFVLFDGVPQSVISDDKRDDTEWKPVVKEIFRRLKPTRF